MWLCAPVGVKRERPEVTKTAAYLCLNQKVPRNHYLPSTMYSQCNFCTQEFCTHNPLQNVELIFCSLLVIVTLNLQSYILIQSVFSCFISSISWDRRINGLLISCSSDWEKIVYVINISDLIDESVFTSKNVQFLLSQNGICGILLECHCNGKHPPLLSQRMVPVSPWLMTWPLHSHITTVSSLGIDEDVGSN